MNRTFSVYYKANGKAQREVKTVFVPANEKYEPIVTGAIKQQCENNKERFEGIIDILEAK